MSMETENWYLENKSKIMRQVRFALRYYRKYLAKTYGKAEAKAITRESLQRFELLLPDIPYIGGDENRLTQGLYMTAAWLERGGPTLGKPTHFETRDGEY